MKRTPVTSSSIASVGYDDAEQVMEIEFRTGKVYQYPSVSPEKHAELMAAPSVGKYYAANFKHAT